jgi:hypothetical protein
MVDRKLMKMLMFLFCGGVLLVSACRECRLSSECDVGEVCQSGTCETPSIMPGSISTDTQPSGGGGGNTFGTRGTDTDTETDSRAADTVSEESATDDSGGTATDTLTDAGTDTDSATDSHSAADSDTTVQFGVQGINLANSTLDPGEVYIMGTLEPDKAVGVVAHWRDPDSFVMGFDGSLRFNSGVISTASSKMVYKLSAGGEQSLWEFGIDGHIYSDTPYNGRSQYVRSQQNDTQITPSVSADCMGVNFDGSFQFRLTPDGDIWVAGNESLSPSQLQWCDESGTSILFNDALSEVIHVGHDGRVFGDTGSEYVLTTVSDDFAFDLVMLPQLSQFAPVATETEIAAIRSTDSGFLVALRIYTVDAIQLYRVETDGTETFLGKYPVIVSEMDLPEVARRYYRLDASGALFVRGKRDTDDVVMRLTTEGGSEVVYHSVDQHRVYLAPGDCLFTGV